MLKMLILKKFGSSLNILMDYLMQHKFNSKLYLTKIFENEEKFCLYKSNNKIIGHLHWLNKLVMDSTLLK